MERKQQYCLHKKGCTEKQDAGFKSTEMWVSQQLLAIFKKVCTVPNF